MGKQTLLSIEISKGRALLLGGGAISEFASALRRWALTAPRKGMSRISEGMLHWNESLGLALQDAARLGAPAATLLREIQPLIRREERAWAKLQGIEKQMGFQGSIALVLPWAVAALNNGVIFNAFTIAGAVLQVLGILAFYFLVRHSLATPRTEQMWLFRLLVSTWMRTLAGSDLRTALGSAVRVGEGSSRASHWARPFRQQWESWLEAFDAGAELENFAWAFEESPEVAHSLELMMKSGAPAAPLLWDFVSQMDDQRQADLEEKIAGLPVRLSLLLCFIFTPAVFLILLGGLWPALSALSM